MQITDAATYLKERATRYTDLFQPGNELFLRPLQPLSLKPFTVTPREPGKNPAGVMGLCATTGHFTLSGKAGSLQRVHCEGKKR